MLRCDIGQCSLLSPIGQLDVTYCNTGLHSLRQVGFDKENFAPDLSVGVSIISTSYISSQVLLDVCNWLTEYFKNPATKLAIPNICQSILKNQFRDKVWIVLKKNVKSGSTITYKQLAALVNNPGASRAVGSAMSNNPISIIVPCHRVINSNGSLGNYSKGKKNEIKKWLLTFEGW